MSNIDFVALADLYQGEDVLAIGLFGSHARGDAGRYSDIDIVRVVRGEAPPPVTHLVGGHFVVVSSVSLARTQDWFLDPVLATEVIGGLRVAQPLLDAEGLLERLIRDAREFVWTEALQARADHFASGMLVDLVEEVQKALEGLRRADVGRLLNGKHGLTWGLLTTMRVQRGVLISGDNGHFNEVIANMSDQSEWPGLANRAFGVGASTTLQDEVRAGLALYELTAKLLSQAITISHQPLIAEVVHRLRRERDTW